MSCLSPSSRPDRVPPRSLFVVLAACVISAPQSQAQQVRSLEPVVITGNRIPTPARDIGSTVTVITAEDLEAQQIRYVVDILRTVPGVAVSRSGPAGHNAQVRIRGAEANHTVVFIDGMRVNDPFSGELDFAHLLASQVERIEVLRGPQSVLHGPDAIGGVINVFTRRAEPGVRGEVTVEAGSFGTASLSGAVRGATESVDYGLSLDSLRTDGINTSAFGNEKDGYRSQVVQGSGRWRATSAFTIDGSVRWRDSRLQVDPQDFAFPPGPTYGLVVDGDRRAEANQYDARVRGSYRALGERLTHEFGIARSRSHNDSIDEGVFASRNTGERTLADYQGSLRFGAPALPQALTLALERERLVFENQGSSPDAPENQRRVNDRHSAVLEYQLRLPSHTAFTLSARRDFNELFEDANTWRMTVAQPLGDAKLRASWGAGVANPTFFELFGFLPGSFDPNPDLLPERSRGFELGVDYTLMQGAGTVSLTWFRADLEREIAGSFDNTTFRSTVVNLEGRSAREGAELETRFDIGSAWTLSAAYAYVDSTQPDGQREVRRPRHMASAAVSRRFDRGRGEWSLAADFNGGREDLDFRGVSAARIGLDGYTLVRLAARYSITPRIDLLGRIENLLDEDYQQVFGYRMDGRAAYVGVSARF